MKKLFLLIVFCFNSLVIIYCQNIEPQLVFPQKPFENFNCAQLINENTIVAPFHNSVRIYVEESESLVLRQTVLLDADPISITQNEKKIIIVDWNSSLYILRKEDFKVEKKIHLDKLPKEVAYTGKELIVLSDSAYFLLKNDSILESIKVNFLIQGITFLENEMKIYTTDGVFVKKNNETIQRISSTKLLKFKGNTILNPQSLKVIGSIKNEIYLVKHDTIVSIPKMLESVMIVNNFGLDIFLLDTAAALSKFNLKSNKLTFLSKDLLNFEISDSNLFQLGYDSITIFNVEKLMTLRKLSVPDMYDTRKITEFHNNLLITYSDLSFLFYSFKKNKWYRINEKSGFKGNLLITYKDIICSGDSHVFKYSLINKSNEIINDLYSFSSTQNGDILYYGSENNQQSDSLLVNIIEKYDPLNTSSIRKVELLKSGIAVHFYNNKLVLITNKEENLIINSNYFERLTDNEILYENSNGLYYLNIESKKQLLIDSNIKQPSLSFKLKDLSIVTMFDDGSAKRYFLSSDKSENSFFFPDQYSFSSSFKDQSQEVYLTTWNGLLLKFDDKSNSLDVMYKNKYPLFAGTYNEEYNLIGIVDLQGQVKLLSSENQSLLYTLYTINGTEKLLMDNFGRFDGTPGAIEKIYFVCGLEVVELNQIKDSLYVPNLVQRIMNGENLDHLPKLSELNICGVTPVVEPLENDKSGNQGYRIIPRSGGVGDVDVYINGVVRLSTNAKKLKRKDGNYMLYVEKELLELYQIPGEELKVKVIAKTANNSVSSRGVVIDIESDEKTTFKKPALHAIMIGVDDYKGDGLDLNYAAKDANDLQIVLQKSAQKFFNIDDTSRVHFYNLTVNRSGANGNEKIKGITPDRGNIINTIAEIEKTSKPEDILLLFFAGHGEIVDKDQLLLLTSESSREDFKGLRMRELLELLNKVPAGKRVLILDACHSGAAINNLDMPQLTGKRDVKDAERQSQRLKELDKLASKSGFAIITASSSDQKALELPQYEHGLMTYALLNSMLNNKNALDDDNKLQLEKWLMATEEEVRKLNANQSAERMVPINFTLGKVDEEVRSSIVLKEIPLVYIKNVMNADLAYDNLEIESKLNEYFSNRARGGDKSMLIASVDQTNATLVNILYTKEKNSVNLKITILKNNQVHKQFTKTGTEAQLNDLIKEIALEIEASIQ